MGENSNIAWTNHTFNPWRGCTRVSPGCQHCYAETMSARNPKTLGVWGPRGLRAPAAESYWRQPAKWNREAIAAGERRRVFCASLADVFEGDDTMPAESRPVVHAARARLWETIEATPGLDWLLLTKRPENIREMLPEAFENVWLGATVEDQPRFDERAWELLTVDAAVHFLSYEPALGPVDFHLGRDTLDTYSAAPPIDWVIVGGESGNSARPFDVAWARSTVEQCHAAGVACFVKQMGSNARDCAGCPDCGHSGCGGVLKYRHRAGADPSEWPEDLRVQQFPEAA